MNSTEQAGLERSLEKGPSPSARSETDLVLANELLIGLETKTPTTSTQIMVPAELAGKIASIVWERKINETTGETPTNSSPVNIQDLYRRTGSDSLGITLDDFIKVYRELTDRPDKPMIDRARDLGFETPETVTLERVVFESQIRKAVDQNKATLESYIQGIIDNPDTYETNRHYSFDFKIGPDLSAFKETSRSLIEYVQGVPEEPVVESVDSPALQEMIEYIKQCRLPYEASAKLYSAYSLYTGGYQGYVLTLKVDLK